MHPLVLNAILLALGNSQDWPGEKYKDFCNDINPLLSKQDIGYADICPIYDKYIHRLDRIDVVLKEIEK